MCQENNKDFGYFLDTPNLTLDTGTYSQIFALNCSNIVIENFNTNGISSPIILKECSEPSITNSEFNYAQYPVILDNCTAPEVANNIFSYCDQGLGVYLSDFANITHNVFIDQFFEGLTIDISNNASITYNLFQDGNTGIDISSASTNNSIHHNTFQSCSARDDGANNTWYDPIAQEGNYWWNYIGTGNFTIPGSARANDTYPLSVPPIPIISEFHQNLRYSLILLLIPLIIVIPYIRKRKK